ncbi:hypothetical protein TNCV_5092291 [Trichonephila clavipes]|nr:hypothetical protein TNCV_5092291 [Trichonephila clavipes]
MILRNSSRAEGIKQRLEKRTKKWLIGVMIPLYRYADITPGFYTGNKREIIPVAKGSTLLQSNAVFRPLMVLGGGPSIRLRTGALAGLSIRRMSSLSRNSSTQ